MNRIFFVLLLVSSGLLLSSPVQANLIVNGGFEDTQIRKNSWNWFNSSRVDGWDGSNIEIWNTFQSFSAHEGSQHAELNAHGSSNGPFSIAQAFTTEIGRIYDLSFAYSARSRSNESFLFELFSDNQDSLIHNVFDDHEVKKWRTYEDSFTASDTTTILRFTSITPYKGSVGNFLDAINVTDSGQPFVNAAKVSEPTTLLFFLITVSGLLFRLFRRANYSA
jgi:hypothetical protein